MQLNFTILFLVLLSVGMLFLSYTSSITLIINLIPIGPILELSYLVDIERCVFLFTVRLISYSVFNFRYSYIRRDKRFLYFHILLFLFVFSILTLIYSSNLIGIIIGWDGLGVSSYILVIYYGRDKSHGAGRLTFLTNRAGDFLLIISIGAVWYYGSWNIRYYPDYIITDFYVLLLLFIGASTKRAQIPFSAWLPAAIAAPTPVSSLVHSSTLVTAGVYLILRNITFVDSFVISTLLYVLGLMTITMASIAAINEKDMKKIVALSTLSQLGLMFMAIGMSRYKLAFIHLIIHAFFKAIMFICTGNIIHLSQRYQSVKNTGGLMLSRPLNSSAIMIATISLIGFPFMASFFSKEPIIEMRVLRSIDLLITLGRVIGVFLTGAYSLRFLLLTRLNGNNILRCNWSRDSSFLLHKGVIVLMLPSFIRGGVITSVYSKFPEVFFYTNIIKLIIISLLLTPIIMVIIKHVPLIKLGEFKFFSIWNINIFSSSLLNTYNYKAAKLLTSVSGTSMNANLNRFISPSHINSINNYERSYVYKIISFIPILIIIYNFL